MIDKNKPIKLTNRDTGTVGYVIPDSGIHRRFSPKETKTVTFDEIEKLSWVDGGKEMLREYLIIEDKEAAEEVLGHVEPEYFYTQETIKKLLTEGSLEQLQDTLEFGPKGVIDLVKQEAVDLKLDSNVKREEIQNKTNFNVTRAIELGVNEEDNTNVATGQRRSNPVEATEEKSTTSGRYSNVKIIK